MATFGKTRRVEGAAPARPPSDWFSQPKPVDDAPVGPSTASRVRARSPASAEQLPLQQEPVLPGMAHFKPRINRDNEHIKLGLLALEHRRWVMIDTETTGVGNADSIVEIAAVEVVDRKRTGAVFHRRCKPTSAMHPRAEECHGLSAAMLQDEDEFAEVAPHVLRFMRITADVRTPCDAARELYDGALAPQSASQSNVGPQPPKGDAGPPDASRLLPMLVTHNARFDCRMIDNALRRDGFPALDAQGFRKVCSMQLFRAMYPKQRASLDACCDFLGIAGRGGAQHGALLDTEVAAQMMIALVNILADYVNDDCIEEPLDAVVGE
jgi:DNA polymerase-3 subunit epsilon